MGMLSQGWGMLGAVTTVVRGFTLPGPHCMHIADWSFMAVVVTILLTPGPTNTLLAASGATSGWRSSLTLIPLECLGYLVATTLWGLLLRQVLVAYPLLLNGIKLVSAVYIAKLGLDLFRGALVNPDNAHAPTIGGRQLFLATLLNPKAAVFALAIFPLTTWEGLSNYMAVLSAFIASVACIGTLWIVFGAALIRGKFRWLTPERFKRFSAFVLFGFSGWLSFNGLFH
jgi:threonine/homoserine/homoserine lactone efflux protein